MSTLVFRPYPTRTIAAGAPVRSAWTMAAAPATSVALERDGEDGVLTVEAPGLNPAEDLHVTVRGDRLTLSGTRRQVVGRVRRESTFSRSVVLPEGVGVDAVSARYEAGVLRVRVAGLFPTPVEPETVTIAITSDVASAEQPAVESQPTEAVESTESTESTELAEQA